MENIVATVERVTQTIAEIANSSTEQTQGLAQIQSAVELDNAIAILNT